MTGLWFLFFSLLISYFSKKNILTCGLWGWSGSDFSLFNLDKFNILGMFNDGRGGDGSGKFMDRRIEKGIDVNAMYRNLIKSYPVKPVKENTVAIGHARRASVGSKTIGNTHPFFIYDVKNKEKCLGVFMHNGTITNIEDLCESYSIKYDDDLSDSYHLGVLLFNVGTQILGEYIGSASCMWIPWTNRNNLFAFRGESKYTKWAQVSSEEKTLYVYKNVAPTGESLWFSSTFDSLESAFQVGKEDNEQVKYLKTNIVYRANKGKLYEVEEIGRSKAIPEEKPETTYALPCGNRHTYPRHIYTTGTYTKALSWLDDAPMDFGADRVVFYKGRYHIKGKLVEGMTMLNKNGMVRDDGKAFFFLHGVMLRGHKAYKLATKEITQIYPFDDFSEDILEYTNDPVSNTKEEKDSSLGWAKVYQKGSTRIGEWNWFTGTFSPYFSTRSFVFKNGDMITETVGSWNTYKDDAQVENQMDDKNTNAYISFICDQEVNAIIVKIEEAVKTIEEITPQNKEITTPYIGALEDAKDTLFDNLVAEGEVNGITIDDTTKQNEICE